MVIEDVHVIDTHPLEALIQAGHQVFARAEVAVGTRPHVPARLGGDDQFVTIGAQVLPQDPTKGRLCRSGRGTVVVGQVEVRDAQVEGAMNHGPGVFKGVDAAKVVPEPQRDRGQLEAALSAAVIGHGVVAGG